MKDIESKTIYYNLKTMEFYQKDNILLTQHRTLIHVFELSPFPVLNETEDVLSAISARHKEFFKRLNLSFEIVTLPWKINKQNICDYYDNQLSRTFSSLRKYGRKMADNLITKVNGMAPAHRHFLFVLENNNDFKLESPVRKFLLKSGFFNEKKVTKGQAKSILKNATVSSEIIEELLTTELGGYKKLSFMETQQVLQKMRCMLDFQSYISGSISTSEHIDHLHHVVSENASDKIVDKEIYEQFFLVEKLPDDNNANSFFAQIQFSEIPITFYYKGAFRPSEKVYRDMLAQQRQIKKDIKKHRLEYGRDSQEYQRAFNAATTGVKEFELTDDASVKIQIYFRIHARTLEDLKAYREKAVSYMKRIRCTVNYLKGRQLKTMDGVLPFVCNERKHHLVTLNFLGNLNILGGSDVGDKVGHLFFKNTFTKEPVFLDFTKLMTGKAKSTSALTMIYGESGSGKSMLSYLLFLQMLLTSGFPILKINPKNDEQNIGKNQRWILNSFQNIVLGSDVKQKGVLDPFLIYGSDIFEAKSEIKNDILKILNTLKYPENNISLVDRVIDEMIKTGQKLNMKNLALYLKRFTHTEKFGDAILTLESTRLGYLMVADDDSKYALDFSKFFTVLTFHKFPIISKYDESDLDHVVANMLLNKTSAIVQRFADYWKQPGFMIIDEYYIWKQYPQGKATVDKMARIIRSLNKHMFVLTQNVSDDEHDKLQNNTAMTLIGTLASNEEIEIARKRFNLSNSLVSFLKKKLERATLKSVNVKKKYDFLLIDYDKKRGIIQSIIPDNEAFKDYTNFGG